MPPSEFFIHLQEGITGGFAPPTPSEVLSVARTDDRPSLAITAAKRETGTPSLVEAAPKSLSINSDNGALVDELHGILKSIPPAPPNSVDIYGLDTGIVWGSEDLEWMNCGPQGCGGGVGGVEVTEEDKKKFKRAVEIVRHLVHEA
ncbi:hypothetical protein BDQ12DRAFT_689388 [Crucibulum laeve]|uniref:Uncharacterized protein n=1 Tax=Crucibulum laeve TaxID=68775 RepID=A0A5C3M104_9AGAR|nr:hypothetical protein BDQ12DRAFT_689388 [Crucibulum laeve]